MVYGHLTHSLTHSSLSAHREQDRAIALSLVAITSPDEIRIWWRELDEDYVPVYVRWKGRDVATETKEHLLRRPVGWVP